MLLSEKVKTEPPETAFVPFSLTHGLSADPGYDGFPSRLSAWCHGQLSLAGNATHFGYVHRGLARVESASGIYTLGPGMYFSVPHAGAVSGGEGVIVSRIGYFGFFQIGGPIETSGRLKYIDGCTDSLLIAPIMKGDPCLNLLYFPPGIEQTPHTHPSNRIGIVARGCGECITAEGRIPLTPGQVFVIRAHGLHSFETADSDMTVIAYHPDSDFGATHEDHPMINRTMVDGVSASQRAELRTR